MMCCGNDRMVWYLRRVLPQRTLCGELSDVCFDIAFWFWSTPTLPTRFKRAREARRCSFVTMDTVDPEAKMRGLGAISREERGPSKLPILLLVAQSVLICACAAFCCYLWHRRSDNVQVRQEFLLIYTQTFSKSLRFILSFWAHRLQKNFTAF